MSLITNNLEDSVVISSAEPSVPPDLDLCLGLGSHCSHSVSIVGGKVCLVEIIGVNELLFELLRSIC